jgi:P2-related tail formation protein
MELKLPEAKMELPAFLASDKNGKAIKAAMEKALERLQGDIKKAWDTLYVPDIMPEWRLDEMAWEWNMLWYDYSMLVEIKREMVKRAEEISRGIGTPGLMKRMLETVFESVNILSGPEYGGDPYHFMVEVAGNRAGELESWAQRAIDIFKPLRSAFDGFIIQTTEADKIQVSSALEIAVRLKLGA